MSRVCGSVRGYNEDMSFSRAVLIVNARSRQGEEVFQMAKSYLQGLGLPLAASFDPSDPGRIPDLVREAVGEGCDLLIVGGGDGTVTSVVDFLAGKEAALGLLPLGTANDFARTLEIPEDMEEACRTLAEGNVVDVDLGQAGADHYVNLASVGLSVAVTRALSPQLKRRAGALAYPLAAMRAFFAHEPFSARLSFPDGDHEPVEFDRLLQVAVGNGRFYGGGLIVAPGSGIDDGSFDIYAIEMGGHRDLIGTARYLKSGEFIEQDNVSHYETRRVELTTETQLPVNIDGEIIANTPLSFSVDVNALKVVVPESSNSATYEGA